MAAELKRKLGIESNLVVGDRGEFTVWLGANKIAEKHNGAFPTPEEVVAAVQSRIPA